MKFFKLLIAMMAFSALFIGCSDDDDEEEDEPVVVNKRLIEMVQVTEEENRTVTSEFSYNSDGYVEEAVVTTIDEDGTEIETTTYTYNADGDPIEWTETSNGNSYTYTADISGSTVTITEPDGDEVVLTLNSDGKAIEKSTEYVDTEYTWEDGNMTFEDGFLPLPYYYFSNENVMPALGTEHWTHSSKNLVKEVYLMSTEGEELLVLDYDFTFDADGYPTSGTMDNHLYDPPHVTEITASYEEY